MSQRVKEHADMLKYLCKAKPKTIKGVIKHCDPNLIETLSECSLNILKGVVPLNPKQKSRLSRYKTNVRGLAKKRTSRQRKRALLLKGGFLQALLTPLLSILGSFLS